MLLPSCHTQLLLFQFVSSQLVQKRPGIPDSLDRELEARGHRFVRYADDSNIYVRSERAGQRVMESVKRFITEKLKLKVNESKSAVAKPQERKFLGFSFTGGKELKRKIASKAIDRFQERIREITRKSRGSSM